MRFLYPPRLEKYILETIGERWRQYKSYLKSLYFDESKSMQENNTNVPKGVIKDQWISLVANWMSQKSKVYIHFSYLPFACCFVFLQNGTKCMLHHLKKLWQDISAKNKTNSTMKKSIHTAGTKSFARKRDEIVSLYKLIRTAFYFCCLLASPTIK